MGMIHFHLLRFILQGFFSHKIMYELNFSFEIVGFVCDTFWCDIDVTNDNWTLPQHFFVFIYIDVEKKKEHTNTTLKWLINR